MRDVGRTLLAFEESVPHEAVSKHFSLGLTAWRKAIERCEGEERLKTMISLVIAMGVGLNDEHSGGFYFEPEWRKEGARRKAWSRALQASASVSEVHSRLMELTRQWRLPSRTRSAPPLVRPL